MLKTVLKPFFHFLLKPSAEKKTPTDLELDALKSKLHFYLPDTLHLVNLIFKAELRRFFLYRWKHLTGFVLVSSLLITISYLGIKTYIEPRIIHHEIQITDTVYVNNLRPFNEFVKKVSYRESSEIFDIISIHGMLGAFQFDLSTLEGIGIKVSSDEFLNNKELQIGAFKLLLQKNRKTFKEYINKWNFKSIKNVKGTVTESGILMMMHLKPKDAKLFFDSNGENIGTGDANGVTVNKYCEIFSGYEVP